MTADEFRRQILSNRVNAALLARLPSLHLPQCYLVAGCLFQAVWNQLSGAPAQRGVKDYDIFYFDDHDLSWEAEDAVIRRIEGLVRDLGIETEPRNQARVHLWYAERFGDGYPQLTSSRDGIDHYLISCTCVGIEVATGNLYAPNGLDELEAGILRINPRNARPELYRQKAESYRQRWPWLTIAD